MGEGQGSLREIRTLPDNLEKILREGHGGFITEETLRDSLEKILRRVKSIQGRKNIVLGEFCLLRHDSMIELSIESWRVSLHISFKDFEKAFDSIHHFS